jgi:hypothetical protein
VLAIAGDRTDSRRLWISYAGLLGEL